MNALELRRRTLGKGVYKKTVEGNPAIAQGSLARRYPGITMQGWTEQAQYEGNQLFDASVFDEMEKSGVSVSVDNGVITASGMSESAIWIQSANMTEEDFKKFKSGNIYVKNYKTSDCNYEVGIYINNTTVKEGDSPYNIPDGYLETNPNNVYFFIDIRAGVELKGSCKPIVYQDGDGTWEPYTGGQPSPSPDYPQEIVSAGKYDEATGKYQYEVKLTGKNLFDAEYFRTTLDWKLPADRNGYPYIPIYIGKGNKITISTDGTPSEGLGFYCTIARTNKNTSGNVYTWIYHSTNANLIKTNVSFGVVEDDYIYFSLNTWHGNIEKFLNAFPNFQIEISAQKTDYQHYTEQTVTLTADRPLTKWDKLEKRNGQWGWVYKSGSYIFDGSTDENWNVTASSKYTFTMDINGAMFINSFCDRYIFKPASWVSNDFGIYSDNGFSTKYFRPPSADVETVEQWKTFLSQNPLTVVCETKEETFVPLSESEQEQMNELYTFRPTTVLSNDCECEMALTYKTKKSLEVTT